MTVNNAELFEYAYQHLMVIGWPAIIYFAWRASKFVTEITAVATKAVSQVDKMASEHFPAMCGSLQKQDGLLHSMDNSLKTIAERSQPVTMVAMAQPADRRRRIKR
jgi:hypothetical protein